MALIEDSQATGIIGNRLYPFNEAYAKQAKVLSQRFNIKGFTTSDAINEVFENRHNFQIINSRFLDSPFPLSILNGSVVYINLKLFEKKYDRLILFGGIESKFLSYIELSKCVPVIATIDDESMLPYFVNNVAPKLPNIVAQSRSVECKLKRAGVSSEKIEFSYPLVDTTSLSRTTPPDTSDGLRLLFASAPNTANSDENMFHEKGIPVLLEAFRNHLREHDSELYLLWRDHHNDDLRDSLTRLSIKDNVTVINEIVDVNRYFQSSHATIIPFQSDLRSPSYPLSALESLYCGRPIISTDAVELPRLIDQYECGISTDKKVDGIESALNELSENYQKYQRCCPSESSKIFSGGFQNEP